jgi:formylglycine-generating enzyme required for sulfatase activity
MTRRVLVIAGLVGVTAGCSKPNTEPTPSSASAAQAVGCPPGTVAIEGGSYHVADSAVVSTLPSFCIDKTEVTVKAYAKCVTAKACSEPDTFDAATYPKAACNYGAPGHDEHPVNCVGFSQAEDFCRWSGERLPSRDEWTWVARGGARGSTFPWGDDPPSKDRLDACGSECPKFMASVHNDEAIELGLTSMYDGDDGFGSTAPVGSFPKGATTEGVVDLAGNVAEWTSTPGNDPNAPNAKLAVGGSWLDDVPALVRADAAHAVSIDRRAVDVGLRCAKSL